jgi:hypothetical protein
MLATLLRGAKLGIAVIQRRSLLTDAFGPPACDGLGLNLNLA